MRRRPVIILLATLIVLVLGGGAGAAVTYHANLRPAYVKDGLLVILAIGSDVGPPHRPANPLAGRADALHLIAVDAAAGRATIVDFPRDSLIGGTKVNAHLAYGGPDRLEAELEAYTGIPIDFWALWTFRSVENVVDGLGGVDVIVDQPMHDRFSGSNFEPGPQRIAGWQALTYVRDRKSVRGGDLGRTAHQGMLMRFAHAQVRVHNADLASLTRLVGLFARNTITNIPADQLLPLALLAVQIEPAAVHQVPLGGPTGVGAGGASIVRLAPGHTFERIRAGQVGPP